MNVASLFIRIQATKEECWRAHIRKKNEEALRLAAMIEELARNLKEDLAKQGA